MIRTQLRGSALFVGQLILDHVAQVEHVPTGDEKVEALQTVEQPGGNSPIATVTCAKLGFKPDLVSGIGNDLPGSMIERVIRDAGIHWHPRAMTKTPTSIILSSEKGRAIISPSEEDIVYTEDFPRLDIRGCRLVFVDGRQFDAAKYYVAEAERLGIDTYCDFGRKRPGIEELLPKIKFPSVSARFCEQMGRSVDAMLNDLGKHSKVAIVTLGNDGLKYAVEGGSPTQLPAFKVAQEEIVDENGAGDGFNGGRVFADLIWPNRSLQERLRFAMAVPAFTIKRFGNEPPTLEEVYRTLRHYGIRLAA